MVERHVISEIRRIGLSNPKRRTRTKTKKGAARLTPGRQKKATAPYEPTALVRMEDDPFMRI